MRVALTLAVLLSAAPLAAQGAVSPPIYPGLDGDALTVALASGYAPSATYSYDRARDTLFVAVYRERAADGAYTDSLRCLYSGRAVWVDPALDPSAAAWAATPRFSTEHLWPQNRGATEGTAAHADMHHLVPAMQSVNSSRGDHPFGEVPDADADRWWGPDGTTRTTAPPVSVRDLFTEKLNGAGATLEPRESVAGDVARALFYVWTVYGPSGADQLDAAFWRLQLDVLLDWHAQDPPNPAEITRTRTIEAHQGTPNPFVLDATLAARAFGPPPEEPAPGPVVALATLAAEQTGHATVHVAWTTSAESGAAAFRIDGRPDTLGAAWTPWATTAASGHPADYTLHLSGLALGVWRVRLTATDADGAETALGDVGLTIQTPTDDEDAPDDRPLALALPVPNPTAGRATATLTVARPTHVLAVVYDALGREAAVVLDQVTVGRVDVHVDTTALAPGVYTLRAVALDGSAAESRRFTVAR